MGDCFQFSSFSCFLICLSKKGLGGEENLCHSKAGSKVVKCASVTNDVLWGFEFATIVGSHTRVWSV